MLHSAALNKRKFVKATNQFFVRNDSDEFIIPRLPTQKELEEDNWGASTKSAAMPSSSG